ncbi:MAG: family 20 glycosylhydrolase [Acidobacteriia bacterium]|nr:family 20 glycosylhydrolase [Terriglobia bacterium]
MMKLAAALLIAAGLFAGEPDLMPWPAKISTGQGSLAIGQTFQVALTGYSEPRVRAAAERLMARLALQTGIPLAAAPIEDPSRATLLIYCDHAGEAIQQLGEDESYRLGVTGQQARLDAPSPLGVLRGIETFLQLVEATPEGFAAPAVAIEDHPRFQWRGLLLDVSRHWIPIEVVKRNLDGMAAVKLNVFHWHLADDQGFRIESQRFPKLQGFGSDGHYYTQEQVRDLIGYARDRGIRVVPEFDVPGHTTSWLVGYPALASAPGPYEIGRHWGVFDATMDPTRESTYEFLDAFIGEMAPLFPDRYFHIGGDEVNGKQWGSSAHIRAFLREHKLKDDHDLQAYFNRRVQSILAKYGKRMEGWDEILDPDLPKDIAMQSWRGQKSLAEAARLGYSTILSSGYYLDHMEPASVLYAVDPHERESNGLTGQEQARILGGEVAMWGEYISAENVDSRIWPRTAAIAERFWSPEEVKDVASMYRRLEAVSRNLDWLGLTHHSSYHTMLERLAGGHSIQPLKTLADVVEPANLGQRTRTHKYTQETPLNRLVDAARPESRVAREFAALVDGMDHAGLRAWLILWRDNPQRLQPILEASFLLKEDIPLSQDLGRLGSIGLEALDYLDRGQRPPAAWLAEQRKFLENAQKLRFELRLAVAPPVQKLVEAAAR